METYLGSQGSTCLHFWQVLARVVCFCLFSSFAGKKIWRKTWLIMATTINLHSIKRRILSPWSLFCPKDKNQNRSGRNENSFWLSWIFFAVQNITWKWLHVSHAWDLVALLRKTFVVITGLEGRLFCHNIFTIHCTNSMIISNHCRQQYFWSQNVAFFLVSSMVRDDVWRLKCHWSYKMFLSLCSFNPDSEYLHVYWCDTESELYDSLKPRSSKPGEPEMNYWFVALGVHK